MDVDAFVVELLSAFTEADLFDRVKLGTEGPIAEGYGYFKGRSECWVRFYFNQRTQTLAFALICQEHRVWGIDRDNRRGWHMHSVEHPTDHVPIASLSVTEIIRHLCNVLDAYQSKQ